MTNANDPEPRYVMAPEPPVIDKPKKSLEWRPIFMQSLEILGIIILCAGVALLELGLGVLLFGLYVAYLANSDSRLTRSK